MVMVWITVPMIRTQGMDCYILRCFVIVVTALFRTAAFLTPALYRAIYCFDVRIFNSQ